MELTIIPFELKLKYAFTIAINSRIFTPIVFVKVSHNGLIAYGECSMPPYLGETIDTAIEFLKKIQLSEIDIENLDDSLAYIDSIDSDNNAAKAAMDIALHDLAGKTKNIALHKMLETGQSTMPVTSCTIGIDSQDILKKKVHEAKDFYVLKIKLGSEDDKGLIKTIRNYTDKPLYVDANQGWKNYDEAARMMEYLQKQNVQLVEQPLLKTDLDSHFKLKQLQILPVVADESFKRMAQLDDVTDCFDGINIKLMKCTGINEASKIIKKARLNNLKIMIGCMSESSCAIRAAMALAPLCDWADLDGPFLISNNPFDEIELKEGKLLLNDEPGLGVKENKQGLAPIILQNPLV